MEATDIQKIIDKINVNFITQIETLENQINANFNEQIKTLENRIDANFSEQIKMLENRIDANFSEQIKTLENRIDDSILNLSNNMKTLEYQMNILGNRTETTMTQVGLSEALSAASAIGASPRYINPAYMR